MTILNLAVFQNNSVEADTKSQLKALANAAQRAASHHSQLMLCPELFMSGYYIKEKIAELAEPVDGPFITKAAEIAKKNNIALAFGYPEKAGDGIYNSAIVIDKHGQQIGNFRKLHLPGNFEKTWFKSGDEFIKFEIEDVRTSILICYDCEYPETVRKLALSGIELLLVPTALSSTYEIVSQKIIPSRAFENGIFIAYADCCGQDNGMQFAGQSCIVDAQGNDLARAGLTQEIIYAQIDTSEAVKAQITMPYLTERRPELYF